MNRFGQMVQGGFLSCDTEMSLIISAACPIFGENYAPKHGMPYTWNKTSFDLNLIFEEKDMKSAQRAISNDDVLNELEKEATPKARRGHCRR